MELSTGKLRHASSERPLTHGADPVQRRLSRMAWPVDGAARGACVAALLVVATADLAASNGAPAMRTVNGGAIHWDGLNPQPSALKS